MIGTVTSFCSSAALGFNCWRRFHKQSDISMKLVAFATDLLMPSWNMYLSFSVKQMTMCSAQKTANPSHGSLCTSEPFTHFWWNSQQFWECQGGQQKAEHSWLTDPHKELAFFRSNMADMEAQEAHGHGPSGHSVLSGHSGHSGHQDHSHPGGVSKPAGETIWVTQFAMKLSVVSLGQMKHLALVRFRTSSLTCFWIFGSSSLINVLNHKAAAAGSKKTRFHRESTRSVQEGWITCDKHHPIAGDLSYSSYSHRAAQSKDSKVQSKWWSERQNKIRGQDMREFIENKGQNNSRKMLNKMTKGNCKWQNISIFYHQNRDNFTVNVVPPCRSCNVTLQLYNFDGCGFHRLGLWNSAPAGSQWLQVEEWLCESCWKVCMSSKTEVKLCKKWTCMNSWSASSYQCYAEVSLQPQPHCLRHSGCQSCSNMRTKQSIIRKPNWRQLGEDSKWIQDTLVDKQRVL